MNVSCLAAQHAPRQLVPPAVALACARPDRDIAVTAADILVRGSQDPEPSGQFTTAVQLETFDWPLMNWPSLMIMIASASSSSIRSGKYEM